MMLSPHISYAEATRTSLSLKNQPDSDTLSRMAKLAMHVFEPLRCYINEPIYITSFYRSPEVNRLVGGSVTSQHVKGEAMDIKLPNRNKELFDYIRNNLTFDQLIWEFGTDTEPAWVHVSYTTNNRNQVLKAVKSGGKTKYVKL